jgi:hypothetical protein
MITKGLARVHVKNQKGRKGNLIFAMAGIELASFTLFDI